MVVCLFRKIVSQSLMMIFGLRHSAVGMGLSLFYFWLVYVHSILQMGSLEQLGTMCRIILHLLNVIIYYVTSSLNGTELCDGSLMLTCRPPTSEDVQYSTFRKPGDKNPGPAIPEAF